MHGSVGFDRQFYKNIKQKTFEFYKNVYQNATDLKSIFKFF